MLFNRFSFRDKETVDEKKRWLNGLEGGYTWHRLLPYDLDLSSLASYYAFKTGARLSYGHDESIGSEDVNGFRSVSQERLLYGEVFGAAGVELSFLSYLLGLYGELNTGGFYSGNYYRNPGTNTESTKSSGYYVFGGGLTCLLGWIPSQNTHISLSYRYSWNLFLPQENIEKIRFSSISLNFGWAR